MATTAVTDTSFNTDVLGAAKPVLVDFWDDWCGPCKMIAPTLEQMSEELGDRVTIVKAKLDETGAAAPARGAAPRSVLQSWLEGELGTGASAQTA